MKREKGKWKKEKGKWKKEKGKRKNGKWKKENGKRKTENGNVLSLLSGIKIPYSLFLIPYFRVCLMLLSKL